MPVVTAGTVFSAERARQSPAAYAAVRQEEAGEPAARPPPCTRPGPCVPSSATRRKLALCRRRSPPKLKSLLTAATPCDWQGGGSQTDSKTTGAGVKPAASAAKPGAAAAAPAKGGDLRTAKPPVAAAAPIGLKPGSATGDLRSGKKNGPLEALPAFKGALAARDTSAQFCVWLRKRA